MWQHIIVQHQTASIKFIFWGGFDTVTSSFLQNFTSMFVSLITEPINAYNRSLSTHAFFSFNWCNISVINLSNLRYLQGIHNKWKTHHHQTAEMFSLDRNGNKPISYPDELHHGPPTPVTDEQPSWHSWWVLSSLPLGQDTCEAYVQKMNNHSYLRIMFMWVCMHVHAHTHTQTCTHFYSQVHHLSLINTWLY